MIKHIVLFKLQESERKNAQMQEIKTRLEELVQMIPKLKEITVGLNANPAEKWDLSLEVVVENLDTLSIYANHPEHQAILKNLIRPILAERACVDYSY